MTTKSWIYVGLVLIGIHALVRVFVAMPATGLLFADLGTDVGPAPSAARRVALNTLLTLGCQLLAGLVLVGGAPRLATMAAARLEAATARGE